jgi:hypothetical protein
VTRMSKILVPTEHDKCGAGRRKHLPSQGLKEMAPLVLFRTFVFLLYGFVARRSCMATPS